MARCRYFLLKQPEPDPPLALSKPDGFQSRYGNGGRPVPRVDRDTPFPGIIACTLQPH